MFVFNIKLNLKLIIKILFIIMTIVVILAFLISTYKIIKNSILVKDDIKAPEVAHIDPDNYTNILKYVYEDTDKYIGQKICFTGYIYKNIDFQENQFVLARDMKVNSGNETYIVGFLCEYDKLKNFNENDWVEIIGIIKKGNYHGEIPILEIKEIKKVEKPEDELVCQPDKTYIPTALIF